MLVLLLKHHGQRFIHGWREYTPASSMKSGTRMIYTRYLNQKRYFYHPRFCGTYLSLFLNSSQDSSSSKDEKMKRRIQKQRQIITAEIMTTNISKASTLNVDKDRNRYTSYLKRAIDIIDRYPGQQQPFSLFLKQTLASDPRVGAQDRRNMRQYCYPYFRLGHAFHSLSTEEKILLSVYLTKEGTEEDTLVSILRPQWYLQHEKHRMNYDNITSNNNTLLTHFESRFNATGYSFSWIDIFPFPHVQLSQGINREQWLQSMLVQPYLFLRIRPGKYHSFISQLQKTNIPWKKKVVFSSLGNSDDSSCIQLPSSTNLDFVHKYLDRDYVIQDYSSQRVGELFYELRDQNISTIWDCCAGSGGKSILALDTLISKDVHTLSSSARTTTTTTTTSPSSNKSHHPLIHLSVSDKRASILKQLQKRFTAAQINGQYYTSFEFDLELPSSSSSNHHTFFQQKQDSFDLVIADVPCSGSGTWARTPEQLYCFQQENTLDEFVMKQRRILANLPPVVSKGGYLLYCTCSIFARENEEQVTWFTQTYPNFTIEKSLVFNGIYHRADTLFACVMRKME